MKILNQKGLSILETLIAIGIMAVLMVGFLSMISNQQKEIKSVSEILAGLDLQKNLITVLAEGSVCNYILNNPASATFNSNNLPQTITPSLPIYASVSSGTPGVVIAQIGQPASVYSNSMVVKSIKLNIINGSGTTYTGNWIIDFDETKSVRPHKPIAISTMLTVDSSIPTTAKITGCMGSSGNNAFVQKCGVNEVMSGYNSDGTIACENLDTKYLKLDGTATMTGSLKLGNNNLITSGTLVSGKSQLNDIIVENAACSSDGLVSRDTGGQLFSCQSNTWKKANSSLNRLNSGNLVSSLANAVGLASTVSCSSGDGGLPASCLGAFGAGVGTIHGVTMNSAGSAMTVMRSSTYGTPIQYTYTRSGATNNYCRAGGECITAGIDGWSLNYVEGNGRTTTASGLWSN